MSTQSRKSSVGSSRVERSVRERFNPLPMISPSIITSWHSRFRQGWLREAALMWDEIEDTDDTCKVTAAKRKKSVARHGYKFETVDNSRRARQHMETLKYFYDNLVSTSAIEPDERGGVPLLLRQMQDSVGKRYAVHEKLFELRDGRLTATLNFCPLWWFERTTGRLRYLLEDGDSEGVEMDRKDWMITTGDGVMRACAVAYMFKHFPLQDWLVYSERFGHRAVKGSVDAEPGDAAWTQMEDTVYSLAAGDGVVISDGSDIDTIDFGSAGDLPYDALISRMERAIMTLWRGGDLATQSAPDSVGSNLQDDEVDILDSDDTANCTDVLNEQLDRDVIRLVHGDATPLAFIVINAPVKDDRKIELETDKGLDDMGYEEEIEELQRRYSRPTLKAKAKPEAVAPAAAPVVDGEASAGNPAKAVKAKAGEDLDDAIANERRPGFFARLFRRSVANERQDDLDDALEALGDKAAESLAAAAAQTVGGPAAADLTPFYRRIAAAIELDDDAMEDELIAIYNEAPSALEALIANPAIAAPLADLFATAIVNGAVEGARMQEGAQ